MRFTFSEVQQEVRAAARRFAQAEVLPRAEALAEAPDPALEARLDELGFWGLTLAEGRGGAGLDAMTYALAVSELARVSPSLAWRLALHAGPAHAALQTTDLPLEETAVASGRCSWGTLAPSGRYVVVGTKAYDAPAHTAVETMGLSGLGDFTLGESVAECEDASAWADLGASAVMVGAARGAVDAAVAYAQEREQFGRAIAKFQAIQWKLADGATLVDAAELMTWRAATDLGHAAAARLMASRVSVEVCSEALQVHGGYGYTKEYPVERMLRACRMLASKDAARVAVSARFA